MKIHLFILLFLLSPGTSTSLRVNIGEPLIQLTVPTSIPWRQRLGLCLDTSGGWDASYLLSLDDSSCCSFFITLSCLPFFRLVNAPLPCFLIFPAVTTFVVLIRQCCNCQLTHPTTTRLNFQRAGSTSFHCWMSGPSHGRSSSIIVD